MHFDVEILLRFLLAALWGGIVGSERQYRSKSAGFRTMIMISMVACFFTIMSIQIGGPGNPDRIASNIVTGIGFLGAGVIFRGENRINGITTAATIWAVAAVGMGIGAGYYFPAASASILILFVLAVLPYFENIIERLNQSKVYSIACPFSENTTTRYEEILKTHRLRYKLTKQLKENSLISITWETEGHAKSHESFIAEMMRDGFLEKFEYV